MSGIDPGELRPVEMRVAYQWICHECGTVNQVRTVAFTREQYDSCDFAELRACQGLPGGVVVMSPQRMECLTCGHEVHSPRVQGKPTVMLEAAYDWTCEDCGRDNMQRGCRVIVDPRPPSGDPNEAPWISGNVGMIPPLRVLCSHCDSWFRSSDTEVITEAPDLEIPPASD